MPSIKGGVNISISNLDAIKMSGTISKHNYLRAIGVAKQLQKILEKSGEIVDLDQALLVLPDFYMLFHIGILHIYWSHICEFLNNILWAIHSYLESEFRKSIHRVDSQNAEFSSYGCDVWRNMNSEYARDCYCELMHRLTEKPNVRKFIVSDRNKVV